MADIGNFAELMRFIDNQRSLSEELMRFIANQRNILEEEKRQKEEAQKKAQHIDELFDAIEYIIASSQKELDELEEARANMLEEIDQKRKQILQRMEALRSRVAKLGAKQENIQPKKDERIREMEGK